jgi:hypothetical protein
MSKVQVTCITKPHPQIIRVAQRSDSALRLFTTAPGPFDSSCVTTWQPPSTGMSSHVWQALTPDRSPNHPRRIR